MGFGLGNLSGSEILILLLIVLLVFGANRLPDTGRAIGKGLREFKRALSDAQDSIERPDEPGAPRAPRPAAPPAPARDATPKRLVE